MKLIIIILSAVITMISVYLPAYLYARGLPLSWSLALFAGFAIVAVLGAMLGKRL